MFREEDLSFPTEGGIELSAVRNLTPRQREVLAVLMEGKCKQNNRPDFKPCGADSESSCHRHPQGPECDQPHPSGAQGRQSVGGAVAGTHSTWARRHRVSLAFIVNEPWELPPPYSLVGSASVAPLLAS